MSTTPAQSAAVEEGLAELRHRRGCPANGIEEPNLTEIGSRIEVVEHRVSGHDLDQGGDTDGVRATVVRCLECGGQFPSEREEQR